tara:strand:+ start:17 stop:202 length:186 start_codon:yes stop_codon:yes gene_type:complete
MNNNKKKEIDKYTSFVVSGSAKISNISSKETSTDTAIWSGGWVTDNFETYYLNKDMVKNYK